VRVGPSLNLDVAATARDWHAHHRPAIVVEVTAHKGSVPRETGTRMLVAADEVVGTIGGGHLELQAIQEARQMLATHGAATPPPRDRHIALGPSLGQCCGGALDLRFTSLAAIDLDAWSAPPPLFTLQLYGAGHVGRAIVRLLETLPCRVQWIDERESEFPSAPGEAAPSTTAAHIERLCVEPVDAEVKHAPPGAFYLVLTHSHDLDLALAHEILKRGDFGWFGLIGSRTKRARFEHRLTERGIAAETLARMSCPIGVQGIEGKEPEVIAVAVVAQMLQVAGRLTR
jgi:xanthine dehydrogenase accessory factor